MSQNTDSPNSDYDLLHFFKRGTKLKYRPKENIIRAGEDPQVVYYLAKGLVKIYLLSDEGKELILNIYKPHSYFPIVWLIADAKNEYYYEALNSVIVYRLPKDEVISFLKTDPDISYSLITRIASGLVGLSKLTELLFSGSARQKTAFILLQLVARFGKEIDQNKVKVTLPVTHELISNMAGLARETVSLEMEKFREEKIIRYSRQSLFVLDKKKLEDMSQKEFSKEEEIIS